MEGFKICFSILYSSTVLAQTAQWQHSFLMKLRMTGENKNRSTHRLYFSLNLNTNRTYEADTGSQWPHLPLGPFLSLRSKLSGPLSTSTVLICSVAESVSIYWIFTILGTVLRIGNKNVFLSWTSSFVVGSNKLALIHNTEWKVLRKGMSKMW